FDAAMTLAKKHFQRLWFPEPGSGGAIPTRAEHGLTREQFNALFPKEFWREVVDRVAREVPDTLLLAEAFWLMEGYFVRTLGMHRVYNSAFMNMFKDEENGKYRSVMKNTLEFDPEILKRFVNFMSNPDEETAVAQFGKDDKYFGVCTMMITMPGLPMFGHGQIEGFSEKYGMEYRRAYWDESPDNHLIQRHEREIFPLLHRRHLFSGVENFLLYDFFTPEGHVNEDVFAYSNRSGDERALVVYHNRFASTSGWIRTSAGFSVKTGSGDERRMVQKNLSEGLGLNGAENRFTIFRDHVTGLEYIRSSRELLDRGLYVELGAYKHQVFLDFREVEDNEWHHYAHLAAFLNGRGVPDMDEAMKEILLRPVLHPFKELVNAPMFSHLMDGRATKPGGAVNQELVGEVKEKVERLLHEMRGFAGGGGDVTALAEELARKTEAILQLPTRKYDAPPSQEPKGKDIEKYLRKNLSDEPSLWGCLFGWLFVHTLGRIVGDDDFEQQSRSWIDEWQLGRIIAGALRDLGLDEDGAWQAVGVIKLLTTHQGSLDGDGTRQREEGAASERPYRLLESLLKDNEVHQFLQVNRHQGVLWFNKEAFDRLLWWLLLVAVVDVSADIRLEPEERTEKIARYYETVGHLHCAGERSRYQVEKLLTEVKE
ncbi:MAG: alpha-amylase, partial [Thermodesulfobacteriota bacterium]